MKYNPKIIWITATIIILVLGIIYFLFDPSTSIYFPKCPIHMLSGYPCPGCGSQRAIHSLLHLNFRDALRYNGMLTIFLPVFIVMAAAYLLKDRYPRFYQLIDNKYVAHAMLIIIVGWWILRIILGI